MRVAYPDHIVILQCRKRSVQKKKVQIMKLALRNFSQFSCYLLFLGQMFSSAACSQTPLI